MTPEAKVKRKVTEQLKLIGAYYFFPATGGYGKSGVPDIVGCYNGKFFGIECKAGKNTPTALQQKNLDDIAAVGGVAVVINESNWTDVAPNNVRYTTLTVPTCCGEKIIRADQLKLFGYLAFHFGFGGHAFSLGTGIILLLVFARSI